ncbi:hypothetical protein BN8_05866 [Fibrisoma limi BUZ 3]|uniref:N-acetyltransferase domain-containing protein n=1 Tax=Fibrisoma limi BUZ 3 TaxID=1185876 RepID=I2GRJ3_9BACT|nr:hypothetical protein [Fibrisoma limi]CCH56521.1 hypothetical protein BN8_05866 [Fibrisoma limi BUZ 3]
MKLVEVGSNPAYQKEFLQFPVRLYQHDSCWIRPLDKDINTVFDPGVNKLFKEGKCVRWLLLDDTGNTLGRVAAFINRKTAVADNEQATGGMGFFECVDDQAAAFQLFDACRDWLASQGMEAMDGPINFGDRDRWWGLLVDGFNEEPNYGMPYTKPYYIPLFEAYGFREYYQQHTFYLPIPEEKVRKVLHPTVLERSQRILEDPTYEFRTIQKSNLPKFAADFAEIYNKAWAKHLSVNDMSAERALKIMEQMKPVMDEQLVWFGYHVPTEQPIAFFVMLPELNQYFKHVDGKMDLLGKLKFLYYKLRKTNSKAFGVIFGVVPDFQGKGIESAIAIAFSKIAWAQNFQYEHLELNWIGDFNVKMIRFAKLLGGVIIKRHITYRYLFDRTKEFKRHPII